eukprot:6348026-Amphidinium_carterae.1
MHRVFSDLLARMLIHWATQGQEDAAALLEVDTERASSSKSVVINIHNKVRGSFTDLECEVIYTISNSDLRWISNEEENEREKERKRNCQATLPSKYFCLAAKGVAISYPFL